MGACAQERLLAAIESLLCQKNLDAISVQEIVQRAGVCRKTFYRNYQDKYALAAAFFARFFDTSFGTMLAGERFDNALLKYLSLCEEKATVLKNAYASADVNGLRKVDIDCTRRVYRCFLLKQGADLKDPTLQFAIEIAVRGGTDMVIDWLMHDRPVSKELLKDLIRRTLPADLLRYL